MRARWIASAMALAGLGLGCASVPPGRAAIDAVTIKGLKHVDEDDVKAGLANRASPKFIGLFRGLVYDYEVLDALELERDGLRIKRSLQARGYPYAEVTRPKVTQESDDHVSISFRVREGPPIVVTRVSILGLEGLPADLAKRLKAAPEVVLAEPFDEAKFEGDAARLQQLLTDSGYARAKVSRDAFVDSRARVVDVTYRVEPGAKCRFGKVTFEGLVELPERPLAAALPFEEGDPYSSAKLRDAEQRLLGLGVLSGVSIQSVTEGKGDRIPLRIQVTEARLKGLRFGGGLRLDGIQADVHAVAGWEHRNLGGGMRRFSIDARPGVVLYPLRINNWVTPERPLPEFELDVRLSQPALIERKLLGKARMAANVFPVQLKTQPADDDPLLGYGEGAIDVGVERGFWRLHAALSQHLQVDWPFTYRGDLDDRLETLVITYPQLGLTLDLRDDRIHPTFGAFFSNVLQVGLGDAHDVRVQPEVRGFVPLGTKRLVLAGRAAAGFLFPIGYGDTIESQLLDPPASDAASAQQIRDLQILYFRGFFAGGPSSNRGYPQRTISPHGPVPFLSGQQSTAAECDSGAVDRSQCSVPVGGLSLWELSLELRARVVGPFAVVGFCDMADAAEGKADLRFDHPHLSCGGGVRLDTPIGPLRADVGYRIPGAQVLEPFNERIEGSPGTIAGAPLAISFGIGQAY